MPDLDYAKLTGRFGLTVADSADLDDNPDTIWCDEGTVEITPLITYTKVSEGVPSPWTAGHAVITATINTNGYLEYNGKQYVYVVDLTSDKVNPQIGPNKATHRITFKNVKANGTPVSFTSVTVRISKDGALGDGTNDLTRLMPVDPGASTPIYRGERGVGLVDAQLADGTNLELTFSDGTVVDAGELPVGPGGSDEGVAGYIASPTSETAAALSASIESVGNGDQKWVQGDGTYRNPRPSGYSNAGVVNWGYGSGLPGYLLHFQAQSGSSFNEFAIGIGTDGGAGGGVLLSLKNASGPGVRIIQNPGSAVGIYHDVYSTSIASWTRIFNGGGAFRVDSAAGAGFIDGVANNGSATFTSATAAFTAGDTGQTLTITHTSAGAVVNATYTITYVNATTVTLSSASSVTGTNLRFIVGGRVAINGQSLIEGRDTDGTTTLFKLGRGEHLLSGTAGQASSIFKIFKGGNATPALEIDSTGKQLNKFSTDLNNAGQTGAIALSVRNYGTGVPSVQIQGVASQGTDQVRIIDVTGTIQSRFDKNGYFMTRKTSLPADADLANGELTITLDQTVGATKAMFKAKDSAGTVRTAAVALT